METNLMVCKVCGKPATFWEYDTNAAAPQWIPSWQPAAPPPMPRIAAAYCQEHSTFTYSPLNSLERLYAQEHAEVERLRLALRQQELECEALRNIMDSMQEQSRAQEQDAIKLARYVLAGHIDPENHTFYYLPLNKDIDELVAQARALLAGKGETQP